MKTYIFLCIITLQCCSIAFAQTKWYDPLAGTTMHVQGRGWNQETGKTYFRFHEKAKSDLRDIACIKSTNSVGLHVDFTSDATDIIVKYTVSGDKSLNHLTEIATSGVDLYSINDDGIINRCTCIGNFGKVLEDTIVFHYENFVYHNHHFLGNEYRLYLPSYNTITSLQIGIPEKSRFTYEPFPQEKPIVIYGTSIAQGCSASRPGMAWSNILQRELDMPVYNLDIVGNAMMDPSVFDLLGEIDSKLYIIDCMPNMYDRLDSILPRMIAGVKNLRKKNQTPILLVESDGHDYGKTNKSISRECVAANYEFRKAYQKLQTEGVKGLYYLSLAEIGMMKNMDSQIDGCPLSDLRMQIYADAYMKEIEQILDYHPMEKYPPVRQRRMPHIYEWMNLHDSILTYNKTQHPEIMLIGNSITHYWSKPPYQKSWNYLFGKKRVANMGFAWDRIENMFWRLYHGELDNCSPKHIFLLAGCNNTEINTKEEIVDGIIGLAKLIRTKQPQARLHIVKLYPCENQEDLISDINTILSRKIILDDHMDIIDVSSELTLPNGKIDKSLFVDGTHPNAKGYTKIARIYKRYLVN